MKKKKKKKSSLVRKRVRHDGSDATPTSTFDPSLATMANVLIIQYTHMRMSSVSVGRNALQEVCAYGEKYTARGM